MTIKNQDYYSNIRLDLIELIANKHSAKVLEIGAGYGDTLFYLKNTGQAEEVVGIDINYEESKTNQYERIDQFIFGDIETLTLDEYENYFDVIILADVLEHLKNPIKLLQKVKKCLKKNGEIISSIPNIRNFRAFYKIFIRGTFPREDEGLFDATHLRFYCKKDIINMFNKTNYKVSTVESALKKYKDKSIKKNINTITFGLFEEFLTTQYFIRAINE